MPAFYPDLVIFHVYGAHTTYEMLIQMIRSRTAAEIAIWTDHVGRNNKKNDKGEYVDEGWTAFMAKFIRQTAQKYNCGYVEIREPYKRYLYEHQLEAGALLKDGIHPNDHGNFVLAKLIGRQLVYNPELGLGPSDKLSTTYIVGKDVDFVEDMLELKFKGNRVDLIPTPTADTGKSAVAVRIDGRAPSEYPGCYAYTRPSRAAGTWGPGILRVTFEAKPLVEDWTARVTSYDPASKVFQFEVIGSKTGPDGAGSSDRDFVSNSKRVVIKAHVKPPGVGPQSDWRMQGNIPIGFEVKWRCFPMFVDRYEPPAVTDPTREHSKTVAQGFPYGEHTLTLKLDGEGPPGIRAIRVYSPPWE